MDRIPPTLDMLPDGRFRSAPRGVPLSTKLLVGAVFVAVLAGAAAIAMLALWLLTMLIPVVLIAGLIAYAAYQVQRWRLRGRLQPVRARPPV